MKSSTKLFIAAAVCVAISYLAASSSEMGSGFIGLWFALVAFFTLSASLCLVIGGAISANEGD